MFRKILIVTASLFIISCNHKQPGKLLSRDAMVPVMVDIYVAEAKNSGGNPYESGRSFKIISDYDRIFNKYNIDPEDFYHSFDYYKLHPAEMDSLHEKVIIELTKLESQASKKAMDEKKNKNNKTDSSIDKKPKILNGEP